MMLLEIPFLSFHNREEFFHSTSILTMIAFASLCMLCMECPSSMRRAGNVYDCCWMFPRIVAWFVGCGMLKWALVFPYMCCVLV